MKRTLARKDLKFLSLPSEMTKRRLKRRCVTSSRTIWSQEFKGVKQEIIDDDQNSYFQIINFSTKS